MILRNPKSWVRIGTLILAALVITVLSLVIVQSFATERTLASRDVSWKNGELIRFQVLRKDDRLYVAAEERAKQGWVKINLLSEQKGDSGSAAISVDQQAEVVEISAGGRSIVFDLKKRMFIFPGKS